MPGLVEWKNEYGFKVIVWLFHSDPAKRQGWIEEMAAGVPGGVASDHIQQEQFCNPYLVRGKPIYYGYAAHRNVVEALPCDISEFRNWVWFLSADFGSSGGATCWLFWAENPSTNDLIIFDEVYVDETYSSEDRTPEHIKPLIYARLRHWAGVPESQPLSVRRHVRYAVGDPSGLAYMAEYRKEPLALPVSGGNPEVKVKLNDIEAGEERLNAYFSSSFVCCPSADNQEGRWYVARGNCPKCGALRQGRPRLTILRDGAPHLIAQLPTIRHKLPRGSEPTPEKRAKVEDHSEAAARYGAMSRPVMRRPLIQGRELPPDREMSTASQFWRMVENKLEDSHVASLYDDPDERALALSATKRYHRDDDNLGQVVGGPW